MKKIGLLLVFCTMTAFADTALIAVNGSAEKSVDPNIVNIQIEIWAKSPQAKQAQETVAKEYQRIKGVIEKFKIKKEDFQTQSYALVPEYNYDKGQSRIVGHRASHSVHIVQRKIEDTGSLVDAVSSGSTSIQSIGWDYDKKEQVQVSLLAEAVRNAKAQADELAKASNTKIKGVYRLSRAVEGAMPFARFAKSSSVMETSMASTEMSTGPVKIQVSVSAEYEIQ